VGEYKKELIRNGAKKSNQAQKKRIKGAKNRTKSSKMMVK
jgi:hypothetical protein